MNRRYLALGCVAGSLLLGVLGGVRADVLDLRVTPDTVRLAIEVDASPELSGVPFDENQSLRDVVNLPQVRVRVVPSSFRVTWDPDCGGGANGAATSARGEFTFNGRLVATTGPLTAKATCDTLGDTPVPESVALPKPVVDAIVDELLDVPLRDLLARPTVRNRLQVLYTRLFTEAGQGAPARSVNLVVDGTLRAEVSTSRLVSVSGRMRSTNVNVPLVSQSPSTFNVDWTATAEIIGRGADLTVRSQNVEFRTAQGVLLLSVPRPLSRRLSAALGETAEIPFPDTISVPPSLANRARELGSNVILISRAFTDGQVTVVASVPVAITGAGSAAAEIFREDLRFADSSRIKVIDVGETLYAVADLNYRGLGQRLVATWEWARLPPAGSPLFVPLPRSTTAEGTAQAEVRRDCVRRGGTPTTTRVSLGLIKLDRETLCTPPLPANEVGSYVLRLRIDEPEVAFEPPVIRYYVGEAPPDLAAATRPPALSISISGPAVGAELSDQLRFAWAPVPGATYYRIEFFEAASEDSQMVTGIVLTPDQTAAAISRLAREHLSPGTVYWRVVAIGPTGELTAASTRRSLVVR